MSSFKVVQSEDVIFHALQDELILLNLKSQEYFALNSIGADMWSRLLEHGNVETVARLLSAEYDVEEQTLRNDLENLIGRLVGAGLLKTTENLTGQTGADV
jgi:hypothetical protein